MNNIAMSRLVFAGYVVAGLLHIATSVEAASYYWDVNGTTAGAGGASPNGTWNGGDSTATNWNSISTGGSGGTLKNLTASTDDLYFSAGTDATGLFTVTVVNTQACASLRIEEGAVILVGGSISNAGIFQVGAVLGTPASLIVNGCVMTNASTGNVGANNYCSGNLLMVTNGGQVIVGSVLGVGEPAGCTSNSMVITGTNSLCFLTVQQVRLGYSAGTNNLLKVDDGGVLNTTNISNGGVDIAYNANGNGNSLLVTNNGKVYAGFVRIGQNGANTCSNSMIIADGGLVVSAAINIGNVAGSFANRLVVSTGSLTNNGGMIIGNAGALNSMLVTNGGQVVVGTTLGVGEGAASASSNSVYITGTNSLVNLTGNALRIGYTGGSNNSVTVDNSGVLNCTNVNGTVYVGGSGSGTSYANNNFLLVTNSGKVYARSLEVGSSGGSSSNNVIVADGGLLTAAVGVNLGRGVGANGNKLVVSAGVVTNASSTYIGMSGSGNSMLVTNGGQFFSGNLLLFANDANANSNSLVITGTNSLFTVVVNDVRLGYGGGDYNSLTVDNGAVLVSTNAGAGGVAIAGYNGSGANGLYNSMLVTNNGKVYVTYIRVGGDTGAVSNSLIIADGGLVVNSGYTTLGGNATTANGNQLVVSAGILTNGAMTVGSTGSGNSMLVTNGGKGYGSSTLHIGSGTSANENRVVITGTNSLCLLSGNQVWLGYAGRTNSLTVGDGATLITSNAAGGVSIGGYNASTPNTLRNSMIVTNNGKVYTLFVRVGVGDVASSNSMVIADGGQVFSYFASAVGNGVSSFGNFVSIGSSTASNSLWDLGNCALSVGNGATYTGNYMNVLSGGRVTNVTTLTVGGTAGSSGNFVNLSGGGLLEVNTGITVGPGSNNTLTNQGGILQFTTAAPMITTNAGNSITMNGGTLGCRGIQTGTLPNLTDNLGATGVGAFIWQGNNTFRLDNCFATNTVAGGYTFGSGQPNGSKNYTRLELVNGTSKLLGTVPVTIAGTGSLLVSNTTATINCAFTNNGTLTITNSTLNLLNGTFGEGSTVNWMNTNSQINVTGTLNLPAVMIVNVGQVSPYGPNGTVLFNATAFSGPGATNLNGWVITGSRPDTRAVLINGQVQLTSPTGLILRLY